MKQYKYTWSDFSQDIDVVFEIDPDKFTDEHANAVLSFFRWTYDESADPIEEVIKKVAVECLREATGTNYNVFGIIQAFENKEGFWPLDGSEGIKLLRCEGFDFFSEHGDLEQIDPSNFLLPLQPEL